MRFQVVLAEPLDADAEARLAEAADIVRPPAADEAALCAHLAEADALICRTHTPVTRQVLTAGPRLKCVAVAGVGLDRVDLAAAEELCISVLNRPGAATHAVAELTIALMLNLLRPIPALQAAYRAGEFKAARKAAHGRELRNLTVGIVGMGRIGSAVGRLLSGGFGCRVLYNDIVEVGPFDFACESVDKDRLYAEADVVTLHVPLTDVTRGMINADVLRRFKPGALLVNAARGAVIDTTALVDGIATGPLAGVALDVTDPEPLPVDHPLLTAPNCLVTPHVASRTDAGLRGMYGVVDDVIALLRQSAGQD